MEIVESAALEKKLLGLNKFFGSPQHCLRAD